MILRNADGTWTAVGIVSYDFNPFVLGEEETFLHCRNVPSTPRAFTRVSSYFDWISVILNDGNVTCSSSTESITTKTSPITSSIFPLTTQSTTSPNSSPTTSLSTQQALCNATQQGKHIENYSIFQQLMVLISLIDSY